MRLFIGSGFVFLWSLWIYYFITFMYPLYFALWQIFCSLYTGIYRVDSYSDINDIQFYYNQLIQREWIQQYLQQVFNKDIGFIINSYIDKEYLIEIANDIRSHKLNTNGKGCHWKDMPWSVSLN